MEKQKLVTVIMGQDCEKFIGMALESVKDSDAIVYCDGGSTDHIFWDKMRKRKDITLIENEYDKEDKGMNGKQRNFYLDYVKKNFPDHWCLCIDADEIVEDLSKIKKFIQTANPIKYLYNIRMRHLIGDLGHEDATQPVHFVPCRLFHIDSDLLYPESEHPVLQSKDGKVPLNQGMTTIWHLSYIPGMFEIKKKYDNHMKKSNIHSPDYLAGWYRAHLFGQYPTAQINIMDLPKTILNHFGIDKDEIYFMNRGLEVKQFIDASQWKEFFKPKTVLEFGCGTGPRVFAMNAIGLDACGIEKSVYAVENKLHERVHYGDVTVNDGGVQHELVVAYDLLEHISYEDLNAAIDNLINHSKKHILVSVPFLGSPDLEFDKTHIIKEDKEWWVEQFIKKDLEMIETPEHFQFKEQIMIFKKKEKK